MLENKKIAVVVPAFNEERLIERTINGIPSFVDKIIVVDDCSKDGTANRVNTLLQPQPDRIVLITLAPYKSEKSYPPQIFWCSQNDIGFTHSLNLRG